MVIGAAIEYVDTMGPTSNGSVEHINTMLAVTTADGPDEIATPPRSISALHHSLARAKPEARDTSDGNYSACVTHRFP
jgi:hypothetical protein